MDAKLRQVAQLLKRYDSDLFPKRSLNGALGIMRKRRDFDFYRFDDQGCCLWFARDWDDLVIPVTHNWNFEDASFSPGVPVDWGIEPILSQVQKTDSWRDDGEYDRFCEARRRRKEDLDRAHRNEFRAAAADCRREFARATNDINTSSLEKTRSRKWQ